MNNLKVIENEGLIKIYETDKGQKVVLARELHEGLEVKAEFTNWINTNLKSVDAIENVDFTSFDFKVKREIGASLSKEYILKLDIAKEICMVSGANPRANEKLKQKSKEYRRYFIEVEKRYKQAIDTSNLSPELQMFNNLFKAIAKNELATKEVKQEIQGIRDVITLDTTSWREESRKLIIKIAHVMGGNTYIKDVNTEIYSLLNKRFGVNLKQRLTNKRRRMADEGICKSKRDKLNYIDVIAEDKKLIEGYVAIVKEMAIKYGAEKAS